MEKKRLSIGAEDFEEIRKKGMYYVDKTGLIEELLKEGSKVTLFARPRRFGKSLNMNMLRRFFEIGTDKSLFEGLQISREKELCEQHMGQYPVIFVTLKDVEGLDYGSVREGMWGVVSGEAARHYDLVNSDRLNQIEKEQLYGLCSRKGNLEESLKLLSRLLYRHYGKKVVILVDEYDVPLDKAYQRGYYDEMILLIRRMLNAALKTNEALESAVLTGCLRISKESIFTGLNNLKVNTVVDEQYGEWFGFTDAEVKEMLEYYGVGEYSGLTADWYDGYLFGGTNVYCPWDVVNWVNQLFRTSDREPKNFWVNTSGNDMIIRFAEKADPEAKEELEGLMAGGTVWKDLQTDLTYPEIDRKPEYLWSVLFMTGYLTYRGKDASGRYELVIPNREIRSIFARKIDEWFSDRIREDVSGRERFAGALADGDAAGVQLYLNDVMAESVSFFDGGEKTVKENFYHGMLLGMLRNDIWHIYSNREAGDGRADIIVVPRSRWKRNYALIIEIKYAAKEDGLKEKAKEALQQIEDKNYDAFFGIDRPDEILHYGIAFCKKRCFVVKE